MVREALDVNKLYQGAEVGAYASGVYISGDQHRVIHNDVRSMYPSIMRMCNFSPESMTLIKLKPYTGQIFLSPTQVEVPDNRVGKQLVIAIAEGDSLARRELTKLMDLRAKYRAEDSDSAQLAMKLAANAYYGYNGMRYARYGSFLVAIATTAVGRYIMDQIVALGGTIDGVTVLENDTDGVYTFGKDFLPEIREMFTGMFKMYDPALMVRVDTNNYDGMICTGKMKNYVLWKDDKVIVAGNSLKGRGMPGVCKSALNLVAECLLKGYDLHEAWSRIQQHLDMDPLDQFEMSCEVGKNPDEYNPTSMYAKILKQAPWMLHGEELRYVRVKGYDYGYAPLGSHPDAELRESLDLSYYQKRVKDAIGRLLIPVRETDPGVDAFCKLWIDKKKRRGKKSK